VEAKQMQITLSEFRDAVAVLLNHLEESGVESVQVNEDAYWFISRDELHDVYKTPADMTVGSLEDDWDELRAILAKRKEPVGYALVWAANILRALGDRTP